MSGSGGPSQTTQTQTTIPEYARPYVESALGRADALTSAPYRAYTGERTAQFTPLQQQAFTGAQNLGPASQLGTATGLASQIAGSAQQAGQYTPGQFEGGIFGSQQAQQYMSPYMQNVVDIEKREAGRQAGIAGLQQQAQAVGAGAFGGGRDAIMRAEAARNLATQQGDIQSRGLQSAFQSAQQQFNADMARSMQAQQLGEQSRQYGAGLGLQGLNTALQASQQLQGLGAEQYRQQLGALGLQGQLGTQQQQQVQDILNQRYADFQAQQRHPYQQLGYLSDLFRGLPMSQTTQQLYTAPPSPLSQIAGAGLTAYGLMRAEGGDIPKAGLADLAIMRMG